MYEPGVNNRPRIIGKFIPQYMGKTVWLLGHVLQADPNGMGFQLKTSDGIIVQIKMKERLICSPEGLTEVEGHVIGRNQLNCNTLVCHPLEYSTKFGKKKKRSNLQQLFNFFKDHNLYNEAITLLHTVQNAWQPI